MAPLIPPQLGNLTRLTYMILDYNNLTGTIPSELGVFILIISNNIVTFPLLIPGQCTQLEKFNVLGNMLKKSIPESSSKLLIAEDYENIRIIYVHLIGIRKSFSFDSIEC